MSLYLSIPLLACVLCAGLALTILLRSPREPANRGAALLLACACVWSACEVLWNAQTRAEAALTGARAAALGWVWLGPLTLELFVRITHRGARQLRRWRPALYATCAAFLAITWFTPWMHPGMVKTSWGWAYRFGPAYPFFHAFTAGCIAVALGLGWRAHEHSKSSGERAQTHWLAVGIAFPLVIAAITDGLLPWAGWQPPRLGTLSFAALGAVVAWSFHRYGYSLLAPGSFAVEILEALRDGVALLRLDGYVRVANAGLARLLEAPPERICGLRLADRLEGCPSAADGDSAERQAELLAFSGRRVPVAVSSTALRDRQGESIGLVVVVRDLAEIVSLRSRLVLSGRLAAVGELAAGIAHEINNPLAFVRSNLGVLRRNSDALAIELEKAGAAPQADEILAESEELIDECLEGVDRAAAIIRDVRGLSHGGGQQRERADLGMLLDGVLRLARPQLGTGVRLEKVHRDVPRVLCAPQELQQVFLNLVLNAVQAIEGEGTIRVSTGRDGGGVFVDVEDDGTGIPPELIERIFDPFFTTKPVGKGSGLGLGIAHEIVRRHGGEISVFSEPGRGSRFRVRLPLDADTLDPPVQSSRASA
jgi:signal transduction histidine kinase